MKAVGIGSTLILVLSLLMTMKADVPIQKTCVIHQCQSILDCVGVVSPSVQGYFNTYSDCWQGLGKPPQCCVFIGYQRNKKKLKGPMSSSFLV